MKLTAHRSSPRPVDGGAVGARVERRATGVVEGGVFSKASSTTRHPDDDGSKMEVVESAVTADVCRARARIAGRIQHPASKWPFRPASDLCSCHMPYDEAHATQLCFATIG